MQTGGPSLANLPLRKMMRRRGPEVPVLKSGGPRVKPYPRPRL